MTTDLQPLQRNVIGLAKQATAIAQADVKPFEANLQARAEGLARAGLYAVTAQVLTEALHRAIDAAYETIDGVLVGCEPSGRCNVPLPWSTRSHAVYGLRRSQADILRTIITGWQHEHHAGRYNRAPVFQFDGAKWYVNLSDYRSAEAARGAVGKWLNGSYVRQVEIQLRESTHQTSTKAVSNPQRR